MTTSHHRGTGVLQTARGDVVLPYAEYVIRITTGPVGTEAEGRILNAPSSGFEGLLVGMPMALVLNDGRVWDCYLVNNEGRLTPRGQGFR